MPAIPRQVPLNPPCESNPMHDLAIGELRIAGSRWMTFCRPCLRNAVETWMNDCEDQAAPTFEIRPVVAA